MGSSGKSYRTTEVPITHQLTAGYRIVNPLEEFRRGGRQHTISRADAEIHGGWSFRPEWACAQVR